MGDVKAGALGLGIAGLAVLAGRAILSAGRGRHEWKSVTVLAPPERMTIEGVYPGPLALLGDAIEVRLVDAPKGQGTELHARVVKNAAAVQKVRSLSGRSPEDALRSALRDAKALIETGQVMHVDPRPHGIRPATPAGAAIDAADTSMKGKGIL